MAALELNLPDSVVAEVFSKARKASAIVQLSRKLELLSPLASTVFSFDGDDAKFHGANDPDKSEGDDTMTQVRIIMETLYKIIPFHDFQWDDATGKALINQVIDMLPGIIAESYDKSAFGPAALATSPFPGFTKAAVQVDGTADSWLDAIAGVENGEATGAILDNRFKGALRKAAVEGSVINPLGVAIADGFSVAGVPVYFRDLGGNRGVIGDFSKAVAATYAGLESQIFSPQTDSRLRRANKYEVYTGIRTGFAVLDQAAFQPVELAV